MSFVQPFIGKISYVSPKLENDPCCILNINIKNIIINLKMSRLSERDIFSWRKSFHLFTRGESLVARTCDGKKKSKDLTGCHIYIKWS